MMITENPRIMEENQVREISVDLREIVDGEGFYRRTLDDKNPPRLELGQRLRFSIRLSGTIRSGVSLGRVMLVFEGQTPLRGENGHPLFEVPFESTGVSATWLSPPLSRSGEFHYYLWVELVDDPLAEIPGNHVAIAYPQMIIDDKPPN